MSSGVFPWSFAAFRNRVSSVSDMVIASMVFSFSDTWCHPALIGKKRSDEYQRGNQWKQ
jgi:hypothetical protein